MPARSVCLVTLSLSEAGPGRFGRQVSVTDIYHTIPYQFSSKPLRLTRGSPGRSLGSFRGGTQPRLPMLIGCSGTRPLDGRRRDGGWVP